jgi:hypothetical protein
MATWPGNILKERESYVRKNEDVSWVLLILMSFQTVISY